MKIKDLSDLRQLLPKPPYKPKGPFTLMVSRNLGINYKEVYTTDDIEDPVLLQKLEQLDREVVRYYVRGHREVICAIHKAAIAHLK